MIVPVNGGLVVWGGYVTVNVAVACSCLLTSVEVRVLEGWEGFKLLSTLLGMPTAAGLIPQAGMKSSDSTGNSQKTDLLIINTPE